jgi:hypothetical protein
MLFILIFVLLIAAFFLIVDKRILTHGIISPLDGKTYFVQNLPHSKKASRILSIVNFRIVKLLTFLIQKYPTDESVSLLAQRYYRENLNEGPPGGDSTSFSINKGEIIVLCLRQDENNFADINTIMFVVLHELAHLMTKSFGHTEEFWKNLDFLILNATNKNVGIYNSVDYQKNPAPYCGIVIKDNI